MPRVTAGRCAGRTKHGTPPHPPTPREIAVQVYNDMFGKDVQDTHTISYMWMADQLGHFGIGFQLTYLFGWIAEAAFGPPGRWTTAWIALTNFSVWVVKESFDYHRAVRKARIADSVFPLNAGEIRSNIFTVLFFIGAGIIVAGVAGSGPIYPIIAVGVLLVPSSWIIWSWLRIKITFQQAGLPYLYRLANFPNKIARDRSEARRLARYIDELAHPGRPQGRGKHLVIAGPLGTGTSSLAVGVGTEFAFRGGIGRYTTLVKLLESSLVKDGRRLGGREFKDGRVLWPWGSADLLIVDDVQAVGSLTGRVRRLLVQGDGTPVGDHGEGASADQTGRLELVLKQAKLDRRFLDGLRLRRSVWVLGDVKDPRRWLEAIKEVLGACDDDIRLITLSEADGDAFLSDLKAPHPEIRPRETRARNDREEFAMVHRPVSNE